MKKWRVKLFRTSGWRIGVELNAQLFEHTHPKSLINHNLYRSIYASVLLRVFPAVGGHCRWWSAQWTELTGREQSKQFSMFSLCDTGHSPSHSGNVSRARVAVLMLPLPTCSRRALQRKASRRHWAHTSMIYEPSVASDVPVASDRMFPAGILHRAAWAPPGHRLGMPRSTVIKLHQVRAEWDPKHKNHSSMEEGDQVN